MRQHFLSALETCRLDLAWASRPEARFEGYKRSRHSSGLPTIRPEARAALPPPPFLVSSLT